MAKYSDMKEMHYFRIISCQYNHYNRFEENPSTQPFKCDGTKNIFSMEHLKKCDEAASSLVFKCSNCLPRNRCDLPL
jgi:hypothetical protein